MPSSPSPVSRLRAARIGLVRKFPRVFRRRLRPLSLTAIALLTMTQIIALRPAQVEQEDSPITAIDPKALVPVQDRTLAEGIPKDKVPDYSLEAFTHVSTQGGERQWKLVAEKAYLYNQDKLVHARRIKAFLYDPDGKTTLVTGREAKYHMDGRDLEIFGDVKTIFPDGFEMDSDYLRHSPERRRLDIPEKYAVHGNAQQSKEQRIAFTSRGLAFDMAKAQITLLRDAKVTRLDGTGETAAGGTTIESDRCVIYRERQEANFRMNSSRPLKTQFVHITQPTLFARARRADLSYGNADQMLNYLVLREDVLVKETGGKADAKSLRYATGGKAEFDAHKDLVVMTEFPQVYQDADTVTGDVIRLYRDSDVIEVEHSNAYSQGNPDGSSSSRQ